MLLLLSLFLRVLLTHIFFNYQEIKGKGELLLGQRYRTGSDTIKQEHGLVGEISHLNIWNRTLSTTILLAMYRGCDSTGGNFFDWSSLLSGQVVGQVTRETSAECTFPGL